MTPNHVIAKSAIEATNIDTDIVPLFYWERERVHHIHCQQ